MYAGLPVASDILRAAFPVGASSSTSDFVLMLNCVSSMALRTVDFPVPGPPVIIEKRFEKNCCIASFCFSASGKLFRSKSAIYGSTLTGFSRMHRNALTRPAAKLSLS